MANKLIKSNESKVPQCSRIFSRLGAKPSKFNLDHKVNSNVEETSKSLAGVHKPDSALIHQQENLDMEATTLPNKEFNCSSDSILAENSYLDLLKDSNKENEGKAVSCQQFEIIKRFKLELEEYKAKWEELRNDLKSGRYQNRSVIGMTSIKQIELFKTRIRNSLNILEENCKNTKEKLASIQLQYDEVWNLINSVSIEHEDRISGSSREYEREMSQVDLLREEVGVSRSLIEKLKEEIKERKNDIDSATKDCSELIESTQVKNWRTTSCIQLVNQLREALNEFGLYEKRIASVRGLADFQRRVFHDRLQEIRGNLRVFCRLRPMTLQELKQGLQETKFEVLEKENKLLVLNDEAYQKIGAWTQRKLNKQASTEFTSFMFDHVFGHDSTQEKVFLETSNLIQSALDGFNVCLFAYGQTGSGKTFTMEGNNLVSEHLNVLNMEAGLIPRTINLIFNTIEELKEKGWKYTVEVSILEIYNETIRDLLQKSGCFRNIITTARGIVDDQSKTVFCDVKLDTKGNVVVSNLTSVAVNNHQQVYDLLNLSRKHRSIAATACNDQSSRSHTVFQLTFFGYRKSDNTTVQSKLSLVDLAGSERLEKSLATGDRLKETQHINKSLSCLCDVIYAIAGKKPHIPFRNSKLTMLLKDSLGGKAKTLMFVNISPLKSNLWESLNSLRFASKANSCSLNVAS